MLLRHLLAVILGGGGLEAWTVKQYVAEDVDFDPQYLMVNADIQLEDVLYTTKERLFTDCFNMCNRLASCVALEWTGSSRTCTTSKGYSPYADQKPIAQGSNERMVFAKLRSDLVPRCTGTDSSCSDLTTEEVIELRASVIADYLMGKDPTKTSSSDKPVSIYSPPIVQDGKTESTPPIQTTSQQKPSSSPKIPDQPVENSVATPPVPSLPKEPLTPSTPPPSPTATSRPNEPELPAATTTASTPPPPLTTIGSTLKPSPTPIDAGEGEGGEGEPKEPVKTAPPTTTSTRSPTSTLGKEEATTEHRQTTPDIGKAGETERHTKTTRDGGARQTSDFPTLPTSTLSTARTSTTTAPVGNKTARCISDECSCPKDFFLFVERDANKFYSGIRANNASGLWQLYGRTAAPISMGIKIKSVICVPLSDWFAKNRCTLPPLRNGVYKDRSLSCPHGFSSVEISGGALSQDETILLCNEQSGFRKESGEQVTINVLNCNARP